MNDTEADARSRPSGNLTRRDVVVSGAAMVPVAMGLPTGAAAQASAGAGVPEPVSVRLTVNGTSHALMLDPRTTILDLLREHLDLTGTKKGCDQGQCGACTVLIDGTAVRSCLMFAVQADGYAITTIEGLSPGPGELSPIQDAFCETHGMQCGYCTPAMILAAHALLSKNASPTREEIVEAISGNICRCTGYAQIVEACRSDAASAEKSSQTCAAFLDGSEKVAEQWGLERRFSPFEAGF